MIFQNINEIYTIFVLLNMDFQFNQIFSISLSVFNDSDIIVIKFNTYKSNQIQKIHFVRFEYNKYKRCNDSFYLRIRFFDVNFEE